MQKIKKLYFLFDKEDFVFEYYKKYVYCFFIRENIDRYFSFEETIDNRLFIF